MAVEFDITALTLLSGVLLLGGMLIIVFAGPTLTVVGIVLVTLSAVVFIADIADVIGHWRRISGE